MQSNKSLASSPSSSAAVLVLLIVVVVVMLVVVFPVHYCTYTGLFISPSGISELDCATTKTDTAERSISIDRESLSFFCTRGLGVLAGPIARG